MSKAERVQREAMFIAKATRFAEGYPHLFQYASLPANIRAFATLAERNAVIAEAGGLNEKFFTLARAKVQPAMNFAGSVDARRAWNALGGRGWVSRFNSAPIQQTQVHVQWGREVRTNLLDLRRAYLQLLAVGAWANFTFYDGPNPVNLIRSYNRNDQAADLFSPPWLVCDPEGAHAYELIIDTAKYERYVRMLAFAEQFARMALLPILDRERIGSWQNSCIDILEDGWPTIDAYFVRALANESQTMRLLRREQMRAGLGAAYGMIVSAFGASLRSEQEGR